MIRHAEYLTREITGVKKPSAKYECFGCDRLVDVMIDGHTGYADGTEYCDKCEYSEWTDEELALMEPDRCPDCDVGCKKCLMLEY